MPFWVNIWLYEVIRKWRENGKSLVSKPVYGQISEVCTGAGQINAQMCVSDFPSTFMAEVTEHSDTTHRLRLFLVSWLCLAHWQKSQRWTWLCFSMLLISVVLPLGIQIWQIQQRNSLSSVIVRLLWNAEMKNLKICKPEQTKRSAHVHDAVSALKRLHMVPEIHWTLKCNIPLIQFRHWRNLTA